MSDFWTFGSSEGNLCDVTLTFAWCDTGKLIYATEVVNKDYWDVIPDGNYSKERCMTLHNDEKFMKVILKRAECQGKSSFICQVKHTFLFSTVFFTYNAQE